MIFVIIIGAVIAYLVFQGIKGNADMQNVEKYGGLKNKYRGLIDSIMGRNAYYQLREINSNNVELICTGMMFKLIEMDRKLRVNWVWERFGTGKVYRLQWDFDEFQNQEEMYDIIDRDIAIQNGIDSGLSKEQAEDVVRITRCKDEVERERLAEEFMNKYPEHF